MGVSEMSFNQLTTGLKYVFLKQKRQALPHRVRRKMPPRLVS
jgi:hypothetical protein